MPSNDDLQRSQICAKCEHIAQVKDKISKHLMSILLEKAMSIAFQFDLFDLMIGHGFEGF
jgi:hypothetical protein